MMMAQIMMQPAPIHVPMTIPISLSLRNIGLRLAVKQNVRRSSVAIVTTPRSMVAQPNGHAEYDESLQTFIGMYVNNQRSL